jgi:hypothetical protein
VGNTGFSVPITWGPEQRTGDFYRHNITCNPYASVKRSPTEQGEYFLGLLERFVLPSLQFSQAQGKGLDWEYIYKIVSKLTNTPELAMAIQHLSGEQMPQREPSGGGMPAHTKRTYERINRPSSSRSGRDAVLARMMFGGEQSQSAEMGSLMRPAG